jgi:hypothetical protein
MSQPCGPPWPLTGVAFYFLSKIVLHGHRHDSVYLTPLVNSNTCIAVTDPSRLRIY